MEFAGDLETDLMRFFGLPLAAQQTHAPALVDYLFNVPPKQWAEPWSRQLQLENAAAQVVSRPLLRGDNGEVAAHWTGCYWVVWLGPRGDPLGVATTRGGQVSQEYGDHLEAYAGVKAACRLIAARAGYNRLASAASIQRFFCREIPGLERQFTGAYHDDVTGITVGVSGAEVPWEQRQQWLPGLTPSDSQSQVNALAGAFDSDFAKYTAMYLARHESPHIESEFLTELRGAH